jgi:regulator of replication initiation timing
MHASGSGSSYSTSNGSAKRKSSYIVATTELKKANENIKKLEKDVADNDKYLREKVIEYEATVERLETNIHVTSRQNFHLKQHNKRLVRDNMYTRNFNQELMSDCASVKNENEKLVSDNKALENKLRFIEENYSKLISILGKGIANIANVLSSDSEDCTCLVCMIPSKEIELRTNARVLHLNCSMGTCKNMICCEGCFTIHNANAKTCFMCRMGHMTRRPDVIDLSE